MGLCSERFRIILNISGSFVVSAPDTSHRVIIMLRLPVFEFGLTFHEEFEAVVVTDDFGVALAGGQIDAEGLKMNVGLLGLGIEQSAHGDAQTVGHGKVMLTCQRKK